MLIKVASYLSPIFDVADSFTITDWCAVCLSSAGLWPSLTSRVGSGKNQFFLLPFSAFLPSTSAQVGGIKSPYSVEFRRRRRRVRAVGIAVATTYTVIATATITAIAIAKAASPPNMASPFTRFFNAWAILCGL